MKTNRTLKLITLTAAIFGFAATSFAQNGLSSTVSTNAAATIVSPISLTKVGELNFGNVIPGIGIGTVAISAAETPTRTPGGDAGILASQPGTVTVPKFTVTGESGYSYKIELPSSVTLESDNNDEMIVNTFRTNLDATSNIVSGKIIGIDVDFYVGATLNLIAEQPTGMYTGSFDVKVSYE